MQIRNVFMIAAALLAGCGSIREHRGIASEDPAEKIPAIKQAGAAKDKNAVRQLIKELNHDDPAVRFYSIQALERITGETLDYHFYADEDQRKPAITRWNEWLGKHRH